MPSSARTSDAGHRPRPLLLNSAACTIILIWAFNYIFGKMALREIDGFTLASFRLVLAGFLIVPIFFAVSRGVRFARRDWPLLLALSIFGVVINQGCFTLGLSFTSVGHASIVVGTVPVMVLLLACWRGQESLSPARLSGMAISFCGVLILALENGPHLEKTSWIGDLITLCGVMGFAVFTTWGKGITTRYNPVAINTFNQFVAAVILLPLAIHQGLRLHWRAISWHAWFGVFYMAVMSSIVGYLLFYWALRYMPSSRLAAFSYLQPVMAITLGALLLGEKITPHLIFGGALVLVGVYITERGLGDRTPPADPV